MIPFLGRELKVEERPTPFSHLRLREKEETLFIDVPAATPSGKRPQLMREAILGWLKSQARTVVSEKVTRIANSLGLRIGRIALKETRTRWGSCSTRGNLNFNWRLVLAPPWVIEYLVHHELAHLQEMNHSDRFWDLVKSRCPEFRNHEAWLKARERSLLDWDLQIPIGPI